MPAVVAREAFIRWRWDPTGHDDLRRVGQSVGWTRTTAKGERWATAFGPGQDVCTILSMLEREEPLGGITCAETEAAIVMDRWPARDPGRWAIWELAVDGCRRSGDVHVIAGSDPSIGELLMFSPSAYILPEDPRIVRWLGIVDGGRLVSVAGHMQGLRNSAHIVGVCTHPDARGRGLARTVISDLVARARDENCSGVYLEMYVDNKPATAVYRALGFREAGRYCSWSIADDGQSERPA